MAVSEFKKYIENNSIDVAIVESVQPTHSAVDASKVHGVPVSNIVKSLLVYVDGGFKLFLTPGDKRLDLEKIKGDLSALDVRMAEAREVKSITGYSIGGVPPFGHTQKLETYIVEGFDSSSELVAAAGSANSVFKISLDRLSEIVK